MSIEAAEYVRKNVGNLHDVWHAQVGRIIGGAEESPQDETEKVPPQCLELFGPNVCASLLSDEERGDYDRMLSQLSKLAVVPEREGPCGIPFLELFFADLGESARCFLLMVAQYKTPRYPIFLLCDGPMNAIPDAIVTLRLDHVSQHLRTAQNIALEFMKAAPRGTGLDISRCDYAWIRLDAVRILEVTKDLGLRRAVARDPILNVVKGVAKKKREQSSSCLDPVLKLLGADAAHKRQRRRSCTSGEVPAVKHDT